jgi:DNA-binding beta-propeller fold protein YncE
VISGCAVVARAGVGALFPFMDPATRTVYLPSTTLALLDARTCNVHATDGCGAPVATTPAGGEPLAGGVDPSTGTVYVTNNADNTVSVVDGRRCNAVVTSGCGAAAPATAVGPGPDAGLAVDVATHTVYVVSDAEALLSVLDTTHCRAGDATGCDRDWPTLRTGRAPFWIEFDPHTHTLYTPNFIDDTVSVLDATSCSALRRDGCRRVAPVIASGSGSGEVAIDRKVHTLYAADSNLHQLTLVDIARCSAARPQRCTSRVEPVPGLSGPSDVAVDEATQTIYATNQFDETVALLDPSTCNVNRTGGCAPVGAAIPIPGRPIDLAIDPRTHAVYVTAAHANLLYRIDGAHCRIGDRTGCSPLSGPVGETPIGVAFDGVTGTVYTANISGTVSVVDAAHCCAAKTTFAVGLGPQDLVLDPGARTLYVANFDSDGPGNLSVVDIRTCNAHDTSGCSRTHPRLAAQRGTLGIDVDPDTHAVYTADVLHASVSTLDGRTCNALRTDGCERVPRSRDTVFFPVRVLLDAPAHTLYVTSQYSRTIEVLPAE